MEVGWRVVASDPIVATNLCGRVFQLVRELREIRLRERVIDKAEPADVAKVATVILRAPATAEKSRDQADGFRWPWQG